MAALPRGPVAPKTSTQRAVWHQILDGGSGTGSVRRADPSKRIWNALDRMRWRDWLVKLRAGIAPA
jgi:hypothetical protein